MKESITDNTTSALKESSWRGWLGHGAGSGVDPSGRPLASCERARPAGRVGGTLNGEESSLNSEPLVPESSDGLYFRSVAGGRCQAAGSVLLLRPAGARASRSIKP